MTTNNLTKERVADLVQVALSVLDDCLIKWVDLPKRAKSAKFREQFTQWAERYITGVSNIDESIARYGATMCMHHMTGDRQPYF